MGDYTIFANTNVPVDRYRVNDPLFECARVVLAQRGETYSPSYIQGLSGAAFRLAGPCPCAPTCSFASTALTLVRRLGYHAEALCPADAERNPQPVILRVCDEIRAGRSTILFHAFSNAEWDVVAGFDEANRQFLGRGSGTGAQLAAAPWARFATCGDVCPVGGAMLVGDRVAEPDLRALELDALEEAVRHAHTGRDRFLELPPSRALPWRFRQGLSCFEGWRRAFEAAPGRVPDLGDRYALSVYHDTHAHAAPFLREIAPRHADAREPLEQAAQRFEASAAALAELHDKVFEGWTGYRQADPAKAERAADLLRIAGEAYRQGMGCLLGALARLDPARAARAVQPARLTTARDSLLIEDVPNLGWGQGKDCTFAGALEAASRPTAHPLAYSDIMGLSGLAFRVRWSNDQTRTRWCPSSTVGELPEEQRALAAGLGWSLPASYAEPEGRDLDALRLRIIDSLHAGLPVVAYPDSWDMAVVVGYEDGGRTLIWHTYARPEPVKLSLTKTGALQVCLGAYRRPPDLAQCLRRALEAALDNHERRRGDGGLPGREYWYGRAALEAWRADLGRADLPPADVERRDALDRLATRALVDARRAAVQFLGDWAPVADGPARQEMAAARGIYESVLARLAVEADTGPQKMLRLTHLAELEGEAMRHLALAASFMRSAGPRAGIGRGLD
ncbi:MAG: hypothetical protein HZB16_04585 [Armatimonadetes bacterium]|nr:hypothetical protein [Armatimonadota bacterium]